MLTQQNFSFQIGGDGAGSTEISNFLVGNGGILHFESAGSGDFTLPGFSGLDKVLVTNIFPLAFWILIAYLQNS